jgi:hypothetical protein
VVVLAAAMAIAGCAATGTPGPAEGSPQGVGTASTARPPVRAVTDAQREWSGHKGALVRRQWGVEIVGVRLLSADWMLEFSFKVLDANKAAALLDRKAKPLLTDQASGATMAVPAMENVGELRQKTPPTAGRTYYMIFGNDGKIIQRGGRVTVTIGAFQATDLPVQ